ncbi:hypothetical protein Q3G72_015318 [Acer saccharum]|nr:hypothetical protein Q3G72_015318 [Acer saccharum]
MIGWQKLTLLMVTVRSTSSRKAVVLWPTVRSTSSRKLEVLRFLRKVVKRKPLTYGVVGEPQTGGVEVPEEDHGLEAHGESGNKDNVITSLVWALNDEDDNWLAEVDIAAEAPEKGAEVLEETGGVVAGGEIDVEPQTRGAEVPEEGVKKRKC